MAEVPTADSLFGAAPKGGIPDADSVFGKEEDDTSKFTGSLADHIFGQGVLGKVGQAFSDDLSAAAQSADQTNKEIEKSLNSFGAFKPTNPNQPITFVDSLKQTYNNFQNAILRPAISGIVSTVMPGVTPGDILKAGTVGIAGVQSGISALGYLGQKIGETDLANTKSNPAEGPLEHGLAYTAGGVGEILSEIAGHETESGDPNNPAFVSFLPEFGHVISHAAPVAETYRARAHGAIGEGEEGYFNTVPVTPENKVAREDFAREAGVEPRPTEPVVKDPKELAPQIAPDLFQEYNEKLAYHDELADRLEALKPSEEVPGIVAEKSPEYLQAQEAFIDNYKRIKELEPQIAEAEAHARDLIPTTSPEEVAEGETKPAEAPVPAEGKASVAPSQAIYDNVKQMVMDAGRSEEEADAAAKLAQARYQARAEQFKGKRGTAEDLFQEDFPHIQKGKFEEAPEADIRSLNQAVQGDRLRVARKFPDGRVVIGNPGEMHADLISDQEMDRKSVGHVGILESDMGFATPDGKFLSRQEAMEYAKKAHEGINEELIGAGPRDKDKLESTGYEQELDKLRQKEDASSKLPPHLQEDSNIASSSTVNKLRYENDVFGKWRPDQEEGVVSGAWTNEKTFVHNRRPFGMRITGDNTNGKWDSTIGAHRPLTNKEKFKLAVEQQKLKDLFQNKSRGQININEGRNVISLFENADASTVFHELGHDWLEQLHSDAAHPDAPPELKRDLQVVRDWLGAEPETEITTAQHEKFARGFERYLREGKAPSEGLKAVFEQFKKWLTQIYKTVKELRSPITDDVRAVFDRMLSTEAENKPEEPKSNVAEPTAEQNQGKPEGRGQGTSPIEGTGETRIRGLAQSLEDEAIESGLADTLGKLPDYKALVMKDVWEKASQMALEDPEGAKAVAMGEAPAPAGTTSVAVLKAVSKIAIEKNDLKTIMDLAHGEIPKQLGQAAQLMRSAAEYDPSDPVTLIQKVQESREKSFERRLKGKNLDEERNKMVQDIQKNMKELTSEDFEQFVKSIECDY